jgi:putative endonuclease
MNNYHRGHLAEILAQLYLHFHGYRLVCRNFVTGRGTTAGEVDLIIRRSKTLVFVEIKQRQTLNAAAYAISEKQKQRIMRGAQSFLKHYPQYVGFDIRFDAVLIELPWHIRHIKNAWTM